MSYALAASLIAVTPNYRDKLAAGRDLCRTWRAPGTVHIAALYIPRGAASLLGKVGRDTSYEQEMFTDPRTRMLNWHRVRSRLNDISNKRIARF
jgi:hypothetical protein